MIGTRESGPAKETGRADSLGEMLVDAGLSRERLEECRRVAGTTGESLDRVILTKDYIDEVTLLQIYAKHLGYEFRGRQLGCHCCEYSPVVCCWAVF